MESSLNSAPESQTADGRSSVELEAYQSALTVLREAGWIPEEADPSESYLLQEVRLDGEGHRHVVLTQAVSGVTLWGAQLIVHIDAVEPMVTGKRVSIARSVEPEWVVSEAMARDALIDARSSPANNDIQFQERVLLSQGAGWIPTYLYRVMTDLEREFVFVSATDGTIVKVLSGTPR